MYSSIRINGYRGLDSFRMEGLGRVNLLVSGDRGAVSSGLPGGVFLRFGDAADRVPIGSMGDGMWRMSAAQRQMGRRSDAA